MENIVEIAGLASGRIGDELCFAYPEVVRAIRECTAKLIAVLGVEVFEVRGDMFQAKGCSDYRLLELPWSEFVVANNALAEQFVQENPAGDDHLYILTTASQREYLQLVGR